MRLRIYWLAVAAAGVMGTVQLVPASAAVPGNSFSQAIQLRLPLNAESHSSGELATVDCIGTSWCLAGGGYSGPHYTAFAMTATETNGHWTRAREIRLPAFALQAGVTSVYCTAVRSCVAVGEYLGLAGSANFSVTETAGRWARPQLISPPIGGGNSRDLAVSCFAQGSCEAVGSYQHGQDYQPIAATESHGHWGREHVVRLPSNGSVGELSSVSCSPGGTCVAVGDYDFNTADFGVMAVTESHGKWQRAHAIQLPATAQDLPSPPDLSSLSCTGVGSCTAAGSFGNSRGREAPMIAVQSHGTWSRAQAARTLPSNGDARRGATFGAVSCPSAGSCLISGSYHTRSNRSETMFVTLAPGRRPSATELRLPPNGYAGGQFNSRLLIGGGVDCTSPSHCAAVGAFRPKTGSYHAWTAMTP